MTRKCRDYVMENEKSWEFLEKLTDMIEFLIPNYVAEGKTQLVIANRLYRWKAQVSNSGECIIWNTSGK